MFHRRFAQIRKNLHLIVFIMAVSIVLIEIVTYISNHSVVYLTDLMTHLYVTFRSEIVTLLFALLIVEWFSRRQSINREKRALLLQLGSPDNAFAIEAVRVLRASGWISDGSLQGLFLVNANLSGAGLWKADLCEAELMGARLDHVNLHKAKLHRAKLWGADLHNAELMGTDLSRANLHKANLQGAKLWEADLRSANMEAVDLRGANLRKANLRNTVLNRADLRGTILSMANLRGVGLLHTRFDEQTILPDGTHWTPETDMRRFTDPNSDDFWRPPDNDEKPIWYLNDHADFEHQSEDVIPYAWAS